MHERKAEEEAKNNSLVGRLRRSWHAGQPVREYLLLGVQATAAWLKEEALKLRDSEAGQRKDSWAHWVKFPTRREPRQHTCGPRSRRHGWLWRWWTPCLHDCSAGPVETLGPEAALEGPLEG